MAVSIGLCLLDFAKSLAHSIPLFLLYEIVIVERMLDLNHLRRWGFKARKGLVPCKWLY